MAISCVEAGGRIQQTCPVLSMILQDNSATHPMYAVQIFTLIHSIVHQLFIHHQLNTLAMLTSNISGLESLDIALTTNLIEQALQNATENLTVCDSSLDSLFCVVLKPLLIAAC